MNCLTPVIPEMIGTGFERSYFRTLAAAGPRISEGLFGGLGKMLVFKGPPWQWKWAARRGRGDVAQGPSVSRLLMSAQIQDRVTPDLFASSPVLELSDRNRLDLAGASSDTLRRAVAW